MRKNPKVRKAVDMTVCTPHPSGNAVFMAYDGQLARIYTRKANRSKLADSGFEKLGKLSNPSRVLDRDGEISHENQYLTGRSGSP